MNSSKHVEITVHSLPLPKRIDAYLTEKLAGEFSREEIKQCLVEGKVLLNGRPARPGEKVCEEDRIIADLYSEKVTHLTPEKMDIRVLHEDDSLLVVDKPAGLVVHPGAGNATGTLVQGLLGRQTPLADRGGLLRPGIVHRLDKETSGVILVAKTNVAHRKLQAQFADRSLHKYYWALVHGRVEYEQGHIDQPLGPDPKERLKRAVDRSEKGREALTHYRVLKRFPKATLLEVKIETGRTHQIRVHMKHLGHPVVGDKVYGRPETVAPRLGLHARKIEFLHPKTGKLMSFESPIPPEFEQMIRDAEKGTRNE